MTGKRDVSGTGRRDLPFEGRDQDPYLARHKPKEPSLCTECGLIFAKGRWTHPGPETKESTAHKGLCPACQRIADDYPAGELALKGTFVRQHRQEILNLARHQEALESGEHPLHRIMAIDGDGPESEEIVITTTDVHLPRRIATAIKHAYNGNLELDYLPDEYRMRAVWHRDL